MKYDFHIHSTFSDGSESVNFIFNEAKKQGINALALSDHDTILNMETAVNTSKNFDMDFIPAIELTANRDGENFHVLGYGINPNDKILLEYSKHFLNEMNKVSIKQIEVLNNANINIPMEEFFKRAYGGPLYRAKLLHVLADFSYIKHQDVMSLIPKYFGENGICKVESQYQYPSFDEVCQMIHNSGGAAVIAHPAKIKNKELYYKLLDDDKIDGLEVFHPSNKADIREELLSVAHKRNLIYTGGTDFHGVNSKKIIPLGSVDMEHACYEYLKEFII